MKPIDISVCSFGADVVLKQLNAMTMEIDGVFSAESIESIHRLRVATRRLHVALTIFQDCFPAKKINREQKVLRTARLSLGAARDLDVKIELLQSQVNGITNKTLLPGVKRLILRLEQKRASQQKQVIRALDVLQKEKSIDLLNKLCEEIHKSRETGSVLSYNLYRLANDNILGRLEDVYYYEKDIANPECVEEIHAMRIAIKRLRYSIEIFSPLFPDGLNSFLQATRSSQEMLGTIHDCDAWILSLPEFLKKEQIRTEKYYGNTRYYNRLVPGIENFLTIQQESRRKVYYEFIIQWQKWNEEKLWDRLKFSVGKYAIDPDGMYNLIQS
jgi:CHAD domain-containing protein